MKRLLLAFAGLLAAREAAADPLLGDVGAALSTAEGANANPANAGFVDRSQIFYEPELFHSESLNVRYPGFEPTQANDSGVGFLAKPAFIFKPNARLGLGGYFVPPLGLGLSIHKERIPVVILGTQNYVNLDAKGKLDGAGQAIIGYRVTDRLGVGLNAAFQAVSFTANLTPSEGGDTLASITGSTSDVDIAVGVRYDVPGKVALGLAAGVVNMHRSTMKVDSSLLGATGAGGDASQDKSGSAGGQVTTPMSSFLAGVQLALGTKARLMADAKYTRVNKNEVGYSLVELKEKRKDLHDTVGVRAGLLMNMMEGGNALLGFRYEPASLGAGSKGEQGAIGFGTIELVEAFTGFYDLTPFYQYSAGAQIGFAPKGGSRGYYAWTLGFGLVYRKASLGIDEKGELPGAYLYKKTAIPVSLTYKF